MAAKVFHAVLGALALSLPAGVPVLAQGQAQAQTQVQVQFKDVPAGHWAREAVEFLVQKGLIEGFPDGTFRGNEYLTRYQAALIFFRAIQSGALAQLKPEELQVVQRGIEEVRKELADLQARYEALGKTVADQDARLKALEDQVKALTGLEERVKALEEKSAQGTAQGQGQDVAALQKAVQDLEARVQNLEKAQTPADLPQRVQTLEEEVKALQGSLNELKGQLPQDQSGRVQALEARVQTLEDQVKALRADLEALKAQPTPTQPPVTQPTPPAETEAAKPFRFYLGGLVNYQAVPNTGNTTDRLAYGAFLGFQAQNGLGLRLGGDYNPNQKLFHANLHATFQPELGGAVKPYLGLGAQANIPQGSGSVTYAASGLVGVDLGLSDRVGVLVEANPLYEFSSQQLGLGVRAGLKLGF